jgi:hypothetical protein
MSKVVFIKGSVEVLRIGSKEYVRIYVYLDEGGRELARYADRRVKGFVVIDDEGVQDATH